MGCNCGSKRKRQQATQQTTRAKTYELRMPDGRKSRHSTRLEAEAENARRGNTGRVTRTH